MAKATWRRWLTAAGADFDSLRIVYSKLADDGSRWPGWNTGEPAVEVGVDDPVLDYEFDDGYGGPEAPKLVAWDNKAIYFPSQYDGATGINRILRDPSGYVGVIDLPYPGGG